MIKKTHYQLALLLPCALIPSTGLFAQAADDQDVIDMSPFVVTGDDDIGYAATSTLAGTRLKSDLRDIVASVSIINEEFLNDTAATDIGDVLLFAPNAEVSGPSGNFSGTQSFAGGSVVPEQETDRPQGGQTRVRGLSAADLTRDYFITNVPFDTYNVSRVDVQRGANSALFGLGSPGGIVNHTTIRADLLSNRGQIRFQTDQFGTARTSVRYNHVLIKDKLSFLVAGLYDERKYEQEEAYGKDKRFYGSALYKITKNLRLHFSGEAGSRASANPDMIPINDGITPWLQMGKPIADDPASAATLFRGTGTFVPGKANSQFVTLASSGSSSGGVSFFQNPNNPNSTFGGVTYVPPNRGAPGGGTNSSELMMLMPMNTQQTIRGTGFYPDGTPVATGTSGFFSSGFASYPQITDRSIFDYRKHLYTGGAHSQDSSFDILQGSLEGVWWDNKVGFELAYFHQNWSEQSSNPLQGREARTLYIDPNRYLIATSNGSATGDWIPNPNFGMPVMGANWQGNNRDYNSESMRATAFLELRADDFMEENLVSQILGRLRLTGLFQDTDNYVRQSFGRYKVDPGIVQDTLQGAAALGVGDVRVGSQYALPSAAGVDFLGITSLSDLQGANIGAVPYGQDRDRPPTPETFTGWSQKSMSFVTYEAPTYNMDDNQNYPASFSASKGLTTIESQVLLGQYFLWDDTLVLMGSWRRDRTKSTSVSAPSQPGILGEARNTLDPTFVAGPQSQNLALRADDDSTSWSIILHTPKFLRDKMPMGTELSAYIGEADNFQPTGERLNIYNEVIAPVSGSTEEMGLILSTLNGKLVARLNWYETAILNNTFETAAVSATEGILRGLVLESDNPANVAQGLTVAQAQAVLPPQGVLDLNGFAPNWAAGTVNTSRNSADSGSQDFTSEGNELEITYNPTAHWTMILTVGRQETVKSNTYPAMQKYVNEFVIPNWVNSDFAKKFYINDVATETLAQRAQLAIVNAVSESITQDGLTAIEQREWRVNFNTSYSFGDNSDVIPAWLGDFTIGGGFRWEDDIGIGYGVAKNAFGNYALDPNQVFYGPDQLFIDVFLRSKFALKNNNVLAVQVNIRDLTDNDDLIPMWANPDGTMIYRFLEGRVISASVTLEF